MKRNFLSGEIKLFITHLNARMHTPTEVAALVNEAYNIEISPQHVQKYDPTKVQGKDLSRMLRKEFTAERERFRAAVTDIPIANPAYRLRRLQDILDKQASRNPVLAKDLLEQAAKETGGAYTNKRELTGKDGGPVELVALTEEERRRRLQEILDKGKARRDADAGSDT